jgi:hypothetical protein
MGVVVEWELSLVQSNMTVGHQQQLNLSYAEDCGTDGIGLADYLKRRQSLGMEKEQGRRLEFPLSGHDEHQLEPEDLAAADRGVDRSTDY